MCCSELQCVAVVSELCEGERDKAALESRKLHVVSNNVRNVLQHVAVAFSVLQCFTLCCSVLLCVAVFYCVVVYWASRSQQYVQCVQCVQCAAASERWGFLSACCSVLQ